MKQAMKRVAHIPIAYETSTASSSTPALLKKKINTATQQVVSSSSSSSLSTRIKINNNNDSNNESSHESRTQILSTRLIKKAGEERIGKPSLEDVENVHKLLKGEYGPRVQKPTTNRNILDDVIHTILSQNTTDKNSSAAFRNLKGTFSSWEVARLAPKHELEATIKVAGLKTAKAKAIQGLLNQLHEERGDLSLEFLRELETKDAKEILTSFKGVGPKTAACVLCFGMGRPEFAVDTHVHRVCKDRLQWVDEKFSREDTYEWMNAIVPDRDKYELHYLIIHHGRKTCKAKNPRCSDCVLSGKNVCGYDINNNNNNSVESDVDENQKEKGVKRKKGKERVESDGENKQKKIKN